MARGPRRLGYAAAACLAAVAALTGPAASAVQVPGDGPLRAGGSDASVKLPTMSWLTRGVALTADPDVAYVTGRYRCAKAGADTTLWVSAKQSPGVGSADLSPESLAWYDGELRSFADDAGGAGFTATCDRRWHDGRVVVAPRFGTLTPGVALVEYCLHDSDEEPVNSPGYTAGCTLESVGVRAAAQGRSSSR